MRMPITGSCSEGRVLRLHMGMVVVRSKIRGKTRGFEVVEM